MDSLPIVGQPFRLSCVATAFGVMVTAPTVNWRTLENDSIPTIELSTVTLEDRTQTIASIVFSPLLISNGGHYICEASVESGDEGEPQFAQVAHNLEITSKLYIMLCYCALKFPPSCTVPPPVLTLISPMGPTVYEGTSGTLKCHIILNNTVDISVAITAQWLKGGSVISSNSRVNVSQVSYSSDREYVTLLRLSPLSSADDSGQYTCEVSVIPTVNTTYVKASYSTETYQLTVTSMCSLIIAIAFVDIFTFFSSALPPPQMSIEGYSLAIGGTSTTLTCTAMMIPGLVLPVDFEMEWTDRFGNVISEPGISRGVLMKEESSISLALYITSITTSHGKRFNCQASIHIPDINVTTRNTAGENLIVQGEFQEVLLS